MSPNSLYRLCVLHTARFLKSYWNTQVWGPYRHEAVGENPFRYLPSNIVQDLMTSVLQMTAASNLKLTDLYLLLTSGQLVELKMEDVLLSGQDLIAILTALSTASQKLRFMTLNYIYTSDEFNSANYPNMTCLKRGSLEFLLSISPRLESLESCLEFDLKSVRNCEKLRILRLNFVPVSPLYDFLEEENDQFWPNDTLTVLEVFEDLRHPAKYEELAIVLKYCTSLTQINVDVSTSLELLHSEEMFNGTLSTQYKLEKCFLGSTLHPCGGASLRAVHIATLTCPYIKELDMLASEPEAIYALKDFKNLVSLLIQWDSVHGGDFQLAVKPMLEQVGPNLKSFHMVNFNFVDFCALAHTCPNLEVLKVEFQNEVNLTDQPTQCFPHLQYLYIESIESMYACSGRSLVRLLSQCGSLQSLHIDSAMSLTDQVLIEILSKNSLSRVKDAIILECSLTEVGVRKLAMHLTSLEFLHFNSIRLDFEDAANIVHEVNPRMIISQM